MFIDVTEHLTKLNNVLKECVFLFSSFPFKDIKIAKKLSHIKKSYARRALQNLIMRLHTVNPV